MTDQIKIYETFWSNGKLMSRKNYKDDKLLKLEEWYNDGTKKSEINYIDGKKNGLSKRYIENNLLFQL